MLPEFMAIIVFYAISSRIIQKGHFISLSKLRIVYK